MNDYYLDPIELNGDLDEVIEFLKRFRKDITRVEDDQVILTWDPAKGVFDAEVLWF